MGHNGHPNALANLKPPWTKDNYPKPNGRPKGFVATTEYQKALSDLSVPELEKISNDNSAPANKRFAAYQLLVMAGNEERTRVSERLAYAEAFIDRTEGKAVQVTETSVTMTDERPVVLDRQKWEALGNAADERKALESEPPASASDEAGEG